MDRLFDQHGALLNNDGWSGRYDVTRKQQTHALGVVFKAMDAAAVMIIEAPDHSKQRDTVLALENFAARFYVAGAQSGHRFWHQHPARNCDVV